MPEYDVKGIRVAARMPSIPEMNAAVTSVFGGRVKHEAMRELVKAVVPRETFDTIVQRRPAAFTSLGASMMLDAGFGDGIVVTILEEHQLDEEFAKALVDAEKRIPPHYKIDPDDDRAKHFPVVFAVQGEDKRALFRFPFEREVEQVRKQATGENYRTFLKKTCVWTDPSALFDDLETQGPGWYFTLGEFLLDQAADGAVTRLGK